MTSGSVDHRHFLSPWRTGTVFVTSALPGGTTASEFTTVAALDAFYWANDRITCTVVGDLPDAQMQVVARKIYQQLSLRPDGSAAGDW